MSSMYSGRIHLRMADQPDAGEAKQDRDHADKAELAIGQLDQFAEALTPDSRREQWQHSLDHQHERECSQQRFRHRFFLTCATRFRVDYLSGTLPPPPGVLR